MKTLPILAAATILGLSGADAATIPLIVTDPAGDVSGSAVPAVNVFGSLLFGLAAPDSIGAVTPVTTGLLLSIAAIIQPDPSFIPAGTELSPRPQPRAAPILPRTAQTGEGLCDRPGWNT